MRSLIFGLAPISHRRFPNAPRYEMGSVGSAGPLELDRGTGAVCACAPDTCTPWVGDAGSPS